MGELCFERGGHRIYGELYLPEGGGKRPLVIISHGYNCDITSTGGYAECLAARGIAAYVFDFVGGCPSSRSGGDTTEMSVLTEAEDLRAVVDGFAGSELVDTDNIFLMGFSQGGFVSTYVFAQEQEKLRGLIACFPAYVLQDDSAARTPAPEDIPETIEIMGMKIGRKYTLDSLSFNIYDMMKDCRKKALLIHGSKDSVVPVSYSERAVKLLPDAELVVIGGADHWFEGRDFERVIGLAADFINKNSAPES